MGSPGHAFIAHTKALSPRAQAKDGGYGAPPHPRSARPGQHYWPRYGQRREVVVVRAVKKGVAVVGPLHEKRAPTRVGLTRLLAVRADGQGRYYQFQGFAPRRYLTHAHVWSIEGAAAVLCLPEWHPRRAVRLPARLVPEAARSPGAWVTLRCDLSASSAGRLQPADLAPADAPSVGSLATPALGA